MNKNQMIALLDVIIECTRAFKAKGGNEFKECISAAAEVINHYERSEASE